MHVNVSSEILLCWLPTGSERPDSVQQTQPKQGPPNDWANKKLSLVSLSSTTQSWRGSHLSHFHKKQERDFSRTQLNPQEFLPSQNCPEGQDVCVCVLKKCNSRSCWQQVVLAWTRYEMMKGMSCCCLFHKHTLYDMPKTNQFHLSQKNVLQPCSQLVQRLYAKQCQTVIHNLFTGRGKISNCA